MESELALHVGEKLIARYESIRAGGELSPAERKDYCPAMALSFNERIEAGLVDDGNILPAAKGVTFRYPLILIVNVVDERLARVDVAQALFSRPNSTFGEPFSVTASRTR